MKAVAPLARSAPYFHSQIWDFVLPFSSASYSNTAHMPFSFLARDTASPYIDTAPVTNGSRYHAFYVIGDAEVGLVSDDAVVSL